MERELDIATGESVAFSYELAGLGSRFLAVFIDLALQLGVVLVVALVLAAWAHGQPPSHLASKDPLERSARAILTAIAVVAGFMLFFGYFIAFEWRWQGVTPGKRALAIRVVRDGGFPIDFTSAVVRNVVRILEVALGFYAISAVATLLSPANRRLGDMAAGTVVVRDARFERALSVPSYDEPRAERRDDAVTAALTPAQRDLVRRFVARRDSLEPDIRTAIAADVAAVVRPLLSVPFDHLTDDDLLVHLAATALA